MNTWLTEMQNGSITVLVSRNNNVYRMGRIYEFLGLSVAAIKTSMSIDELQEAYSSQIIYVTAQKLCFDFLHDWTALSATQMVRHL